MPTPLGTAPAQGITEAISNPTLNQSTSFALLSAAAVSHASKYNSRPFKVCLAAITPSLTVTGI
jgi:hypothetical protein